MGLLSMSEAPPSHPCGPTRSPAIRIVLAEDRDVCRNGLSVLLAQLPGAEVVATAADREGLLRQTALLTPDVLVAGATLVAPDRFGLLNLLPPGSGGTVMVTDQDTDDLLCQALAAGVRSYLPLGSPREDFHAAIRAVAAGGAFLPTQVTSRLFGNFHLVRRRRDEPVELSALSEREREVLLLIGGGRNNREIARSLRLSEATVKSHVSRILAKLKLRDRVHVARLVWRLGLDVPPVRPC